MAWLVFTILLGIVGITGLGAMIFAPIGSKFYGTLMFGGSLAVWLILSFFMSIHTVGQRETALVKSFSGAISDQPKTTGVVFVAPWNHIVKEDIGLLKETFNFSLGDNSAVSKDQQEIGAVVTLNFRVTPKDVVALYKSVGPSWRAVLLDGRIPQDFKETTATFTAPEITLRRPALRGKTLKRLKRELCPHGDKGEFCIRAEDVFISNVKYSDAYNHAIEQKVVQQQAALTAQAKVAQASAEAAQKIATAQGEARSIELKGKAIRQNPEVLKLLAIQNFAKKAQVVFCNAGDCPNIIGSLSKP